MTRIQTIVVSYHLVLAVLVGIVWLFYSRTIVPLRQREDEFNRQRAELQERIDSGRARLIAIKDAEQKLAPARAGLNRLIGDTSGESALVAFPADVAYHFSQLGFPSALVRLAAIEKEKDLPLYERLYWSVGLRIPKSDRSVRGLLLAVADLEELDRLIEVTDFSLQPDAEDPELRTASIGLLILAHK